MTTTISPFDAIADAASDMRRLAGEIDGLLREMRDDPGDEQDRSRARLRLQKLAHLATDCGLRIEEQAGAA